MFEIEKGKKGNVRWLIEDFASDNGTTELIQVAKELGYNVGVCNTDNFFDQDWKGYFPDTYDKCVMCQVSISSAMGIKNSDLDNYYVYFDVEKYNCSHYYYYFDDYLFNDKYVAIPLGVLPRMKDMLFDLLGVEDCIFVRPSSCKKIFTGMVMEKERFAKDYDLVTSYDPDPTEFVMVSTPKNIKGEFRFVVAGNESIPSKIIASSEYKAGGKNQKYAPQHLYAYVEQVLQDVLDKGFDPDPVWILDICLDDGLDPYVLEIGAFSSSGLYACNKKDIIQQVSEIAFNKFKIAYE